MGEISHMDDENRTGQAGEAAAGKELAFEPSLKTRRAKLLRKIREGKTQQAESAAEKRTENATAGDDFYADALARFGVVVLAIMVP